MEEKIEKDSEVEVCSDEGGYEGAWFRGILEESPTKSGRKKLRVRYLTLLHGDGSSPLIENIEPKFIRPVPSEDRYIGVVLEEGSVVDADHRDGWWTGLVIKKLENDTFLVYFDSPPDIIQFHRNQLRPHFHWTGQKFVQSGIQEVDRSMFSSGTMVEVSSVDVPWHSAMIIKEIEVDDEKKFIVKDFNNYLTSDGDNARPNLIVDSCRVRPVPPPFSVEDYNLMDSVEAFRGFGWHQGSVRGVLADKRYVVSLEPTKGETVSKHSELRPCKLWENGVWLDQPKPNLDKETSSNVTKTKPMSSCSGAKPRTPKRATRHTRRSMNLEDSGETLSEAETSDATGELSKKKSADAVINDNTPPVITPQMKSIAKESVTPITPSPVRSASPLKRTKSDTQGKTSSMRPTRNKNNLKNDSTQQKMSEEKNSEVKSKKRKREEKHKSDPKETDGTCNGSNAEINDTSNNICNDDDVDNQLLSAWIKILPTEPSLDQSPIVGNNAAAVTDVEETQAKDKLMVLPFAKKSPFWKTCETHEVCRTVPQSPHFSPLFEAKEDLREWTAIGMMVTFYGLIEEAKDLQLDASSSKLSSLSCSFAELEKHGFDVATPQSRINKILSLQDGKAKKEEERKCVGKKIEAEEIKRDRFEEEMVELEGRILELKKQKLIAKEKIEVADKRMVEMKSYAETIDKEIEELELEFKTTPWL